LGITVAGKDLEANWQKPLADQVRMHRSV